MSEVTTDRSSLEDDLHALAAPLHERLERIESELATVRTLEAGLRSDRMKVVAALRAVDPTFSVKFSGGKYGTAKNGNSPRSGDEKKMGDEKVAMLREWLESIRDELPPRGITGTQLCRRPDAPLRQDGMSRGLRILHDRGVVRLDHTGTGGSKFYVLV